MVLCRILFISHWAQFEFIWRTLQISDVNVSVVISTAVIKQGVEVHGPLVRYPRSLRGSCWHLHINKNRYLLLLSLKMQIADN